MTDCTCHPARAIYYGCACEAARARRVLNKYRDPITPGSVSIMRPGPWGNRFVIGRDGTREEVVAKHRLWFCDQPELVERAKRELRGKDLVCCCKPLPCHGDTLLWIANTDVLRISITDGPRIEFPCGHIVGVTSCDPLNPFRCPVCPEKPVAPNTATEAEIEVVAEIRELLVAPTDV